MAAFSQEAVVELIWVIVRQVVGEGEEVVALQHFLHL